MDKRTTHVALDDSKERIVAGILPPGAEEPELRGIPNRPEHVQRLFRRLKRDGDVRACYEAGVSGYDLYRQLTALGIQCEVIAPALTPRRPGQRIKTDRRDAAKLVRLFRAGELTSIHVPAEPEEAVRDLVRCRDDVRRDVLRWRHRLLKLLARHGRVWHVGRNWSRAHWTWIRAQRFDQPALQRAFEASLFALEQALARLGELDREVVALAETAPYREPVGWLRCFRGIDTLSALTLIAEIVDFQRFKHPRELMAYLGLVPSEYSSGSTERRGALTKAGNSHARRVLVEAAWNYRHRPTLGAALANRSHGQPRARRPGVARAAAPAPALSPSRRSRQAHASRDRRRGPGTRRIHLGCDDGPRNAHARADRIEPQETPRERCPSRLWLNARLGR